MNLTREPAQKLRKQLLAWPDVRKMHGKCHSIVSILGIAICAMLSNCISFSRIGEWAQRANQGIRKRLGGYFHRGKKSYMVPSEPTIRRGLQSVSQSELERILNSWRIEYKLEKEEARAREGNILKGAKDKNGHQTHLLSAVLHESGITVSQVEIGSKNHEMTSGPALLAPLTIQDRTITLDALHTQKKTAKYLVESKKANYFLTVKGNQPSLKSDLSKLQLERKKAAYETIEKGHGRIETRRIWTSTALNHYLDFPYIEQVFCRERHVFHCKKKQEPKQIVYGITNLPPAKANPERLLKLNRSPWRIENSSHDVREVTFGEDKSPMRTGFAPQVMACLRHFTLGILRGLKGARNIASAWRGIAAQPHLALRLIGLGRNPGVIGFFMG